MRHEPRSSASTCVVARPHRSPPCDTDDGRDAASTAGADQRPADQRRRPRPTIGDSDVVGAGRRSPARRSAACSAGRRRPRSTVGSAASRARAVARRRGDRRPLHVRRRRRQPAAVAGPPPPAGTVEMALMVTDDRRRRLRPLGGRRPRPGDRIDRRGRGARRARSQAAERRRRDRLQRPVPAAGRAAHLPRSTLYVARPAGRARGDGRHARSTDLARAVIDAFDARLDDDHRHRVRRCR